MEMNYTGIKKLVPYSKLNISARKIFINIKKYWFLYMLALPGLLHIFIFRYIPIYGILIAFKDYSIRKGILGSPWVGLKHFRFVFWDIYFWKVLWNTVIINIYSIIFSFVFVLLLALLLNEITVSAVKKTLQTLVYIPNFISWVVYSGIIIVALSPSEGFVNKLIIMLGYEPVYFLVRPDLFRGILVTTGIMKGAGFGTIIYLAAIAGINPELYESATVDGAHRGHMMWHITIPRIKPTVVVLLILSSTSLFSSNFEQVFTLYNPLVYETGDVLSTYMYRLGIVGQKFEMTTALGLIFSIISFITIILTNNIAKKMDVMGIV